VKEAGFGGIQVRRKKKSRDQMFSRPGSFTASDKPDMSEMEENALLMLAEYHHHDDDCSSIANALVGQSQAGSVSLIEFEGGAKSCLLLPVGVKAA
jgi:hypothetical protein